MEVLSVSKLDNTDSKNTTCTVYARGLLSISNQKLKLITKVNVFNIQIVINFDINNNNIDMNIILFEAFMSGLRVLQIIFCNLFYIR